MNLTAPMRSGLSAALNAALNARSRGQSSPVSFAPLGWYDPSDISTLWQDSLRTLAVTALGQPVGAIDDKSGNGRHLLQASAAARATYLTGDTPATFGAELLTNGTFSADTNWTKTAGWTIAAGVATGTGTTTNISQAVSLTAGRLYRLVYTVSGLTGGTIRPFFSVGTTTVGVTRSADGTYTEYLRAEAGNTTFGWSGIAAFTGNIDNASLMEVLTCTGYPCLRFDGVDDCLIESGTHTLSLPVYAIAAISKVNQDALGIFGSRKGSADYALLSNTSSTSRVNNTLRHTTLGVIAATCGNNQAPIDTRFVFDGLSVVGSSVVKVDNNVEATAVSAWTTETLTSSKIQIGGTTGAAASAHSFFGGLYMLADPGAAGRANLKTYFGRKIGLTL